eukprot:339898_1
MYFKTIIQSKSIKTIIQSKSNLSTQRYPKKKKRSNDGIVPLPKSLLPELPILTNMICDEYYNIDSQESKLSADESRSCLFTEYSLCYHFNERKWIYYTNIDAFGYDINGTLRKLLLPLTLTDVIHLRFGSNTIKSFEPTTRRDKFDFTIQYNHSNSNTNNIYDINNTFLSDIWTTFGITTHHNKNIAHILWDLWYKIYMAIDNFAYNGIIHDNTKINLIMTRQGPRFEIPQKFRMAYEPIFFNEVIFGLDTLRRKYKTYKQICFKNIVIGTNEYSGLLNAIHTNNQLLRYMRKKILNYYGKNDLYKPKKINILYIKKSMSYWYRNDFIINLLNDQIIEATKNRYSSYKHINVLSMDPVHESVKKQVKILSKALIIICPIGGIGYTNFLQPLNGIQIYLIKWGIHQLYLPKDFPETFIPENDHEVHNTQTLQTILKYVDLSDKWNHSLKNMSWSIKENILFPVIDKAILLLKQRFNIIT